MYPQVPELVPYNSLGFAPRLRSDLFSITNFNRVDALVLDYLIQAAAVDVEHLRLMEQKLFVPEIHDINCSPSIIEKATNGVLLAPEVVESLLRLKELGLVTPNSLFSVRVNLQTVRNRIKGML